MKAKIIHDIKITFEKTMLSGIDDNENHFNGIINQAYTTALQRVSSFFIPFKKILTDQSILFI